MRDTCASTLISASLLLLISCSSHPDFPVKTSTETSKLHFRAETSRLLQLAPEQDAEKNFISSDYRIWSVMGVALYFPGMADQAKAKAHMEKHGKLHMNGTSDAFTSNAEQRYNEVAIQYTERYNQSMVKLLERSNLY